VFLVQDFLDISNPKAVLETTLRGFSCLTKGDCICLHYNNKRYYIDIIEARPEVLVNHIAQATSHFSTMQNTCDGHCADSQLVPKPARIPGKRASIYNLMSTVVWLEEYLRNP
jgi:hypothetical protein